MKNILITGASSGIGKEIAQLLSKDNNIFMTGRRELENKNYFKCDLSKSAEIQELYLKAKEYFNSSIDVLINCAGQYVYKPIEEMNVDEINNLLDVNFKSSYILSSLVVGEMKKKKWGRIINIGSISGVVGEANATLYSATKSAFNGFTKALALEVAMDNITINTINPGWVETPLAQNSLNSEEYQEVMEIIPQKRFVEPIEVAKLCEYLITDSAKGITGQSINLCAGLTCGC
ncbi:MAG: SDR family oxidoreductase [Candidatus Gastranaerophilales bacterium]|nr:SDR family oxidoreductase [Candidatus Gastranaerophilales bacterium]